MEVSFHIKCNLGFEFQSVNWLPFFHMILFIKRSMLNICTNLSFCNFCPCVLTLFHFVTCVVLKCFSFLHIFSALSIKNP